MCGRYYVDDETERDIERIVRKIDRELWKSGDIHPSDMAYILRNSPKGLIAERQRWGYKSSWSKGLIFNSRSETIQEKSMFRNDFAHRRCIVPAKKFYEWQKITPKDKRKYDFFSDSGSLYMAGIYREMEGEEQFSIITKAAEGCMVGIHDRMPLILSEEDIGPWLTSDEAAHSLLHFSYDHLHRARSDEGGYVHGKS